MSARAAIALTRASWRTAKSYRVSFVLSFISLMVTIIPVYFVATALQPFMASIIAEEGREYFGFVLLGTAVVAIISRHRLSRAHRLALDSTPASTAKGSTASTTATEDQP